MEKPDVDVFEEEPPAAGNFLSRYRQAKSPSLPVPPVEEKPVIVGKGGKSPRATAMNVWGSVFHPLGKSPTSADRYDLGQGQQSAPGHSVSEEHAKASESIHLGENPEE